MNKGKLSKGLLLDILYEGLCYVISTRIYCWEFFASHGVILQSDHQSKESRNNVYAKKHTGVAYLFSIFFSVALMRILTVSFSGVWYDC